MISLVHMNSVVHRRQNCKSTLLHDMIDNAVHDLVLLHIDAPFIQLAENLKTNTDPVLDRATKALEECLQTSRVYYKWCVWYTSLSTQQSVLYVQLHVRAGLMCKHTERCIRSYIYTILCEEVPLEHEKRILQDMTSTLTLIHKSMIQTVITTCRQHLAAIKIQRQMRRSLYDPTYSLCKEIMSEYYNNKCV